MAFPRYRLLWFKETEDVRNFVFFLDLDVKVKDIYEKDPKAYRNKEIGKD